MPLLRILFVFIVLAAGLDAQITGDIKGVVTDPSDAAVPQARVLLRSSETGELREVQTDDGGRFVFTLLKTGVYRVTVTVNGFLEAVTDAKVGSAEQTSVNIRLQIGEMSNQVFVVDAVSALDALAAQIQGSVEAKEAQEVPVYRDPNALVLTQPGVTPPPRNAAVFSTGSFVVNGNRPRANNLTIDNITATDVSVAGTGGQNLGPLNYSSIKEVKVITNSFSAEYGRNSGSQVQYITKSGTNDLHGELYDYFQNDRLNARDFFDQTGSPSKVRSNQFGGTLGGALIKDKTHYFLSGEGLIYRALGDTRLAQVPTSAMLASVTNPTSRQILDLYKLPAATSEQGGVGFVPQVASADTNTWQYSARIDHQLTSRDTIYGRFGAYDYQGSSPAFTFLGTNLSIFGFSAVNRVYSANINETHVFSGSMVNEFRGGFGRSGPKFSSDPNAPLGPRIGFLNGEVATFGVFDQVPQGRVQNTYQAGDTLTWTRGGHTVKVGGDFFRYQANSYSDIQTRGTYAFLSWNDFAIGRPNTYAQRFGSTVRGHRTWLTGLFVQDDWRITRDLTLNLGLRYELYGPINEVNGLNSNLNLDCRDSLGLAGSGPLGCFTIGGNAVESNQYFQPRLGIAWNPGRRGTVVRAGYGLVADFNYLNPVINQRALPPLVYSAGIQGVNNFTGANTWANLVAGTALIQQATSSLVGSIRTDILNYGNVTPVIDPDLRNPQVHQWNFGVEQQLPDRWVVKLSYVGTKSNYLQRQRGLNLNGNRPAPAASLEDEAIRRSQFLTSFNAMTGNAALRSGRIDPRFNIVNYLDNSSNSNYHSLQFQGGKSYKNGLSLQAAYTWGKSIDDVSDALADVPNDSAGVANPLDLRANRAVSGFDIAHRAVVTHVWEIPWGNRIQNNWGRRILGGWGMAGISSWRSGYPVTFESGPRLGIANGAVIQTGAGAINFPNVSGTFDFTPQPAGSEGAPNGLTNDIVANRRISAYAASLGLSQPLLGQFGTLGRNTHRLNGQINFDWNLYKNTVITERVSVQLRWEVYNVFNNVAFQDVVRNLTNPTFGQYTSTAGTSRSMQLGAVLRF